VLLEVGRRFSELVHHGRLVPGKDYYHACYYVLGFIRMEVLYTYEHAVKKGYAPKQEESTSVELGAVGDARRVGGYSQHGLYGEVADARQTGGGDSESGAHFDYDYYDAKETYGGEVRANDGAGERVVSNPMLSAFANRPSGNAARDDATAIQSFSSLGIGVDDGDDVDVDGPGTDTVDSVNEVLVVPRKEFGDDTRSSFVRAYRTFEEIQFLQSGGGSVDRAKGIHAALHRPNALLSKPPTNG
jgi:hypothetical protein